MPTAVLDWDITSDLASVDIHPRYTHAMILVRCFGAPIGRLTMPIVNQRIERIAVLVQLDDDTVNRRDRILLGHFLGGEPDTHATILPSATVAICTRDRPEDLRKCLAGIMELSGTPYETLVVDNCPSNDQTEAVVAQFPNVRYICEPVPGLNHARNCALREATGDIVAFIDDDAVPDPDWLFAHLVNYKQPIVQCVTGLTMPLELEHVSQELFERYSSFIRGFDRRIFDPLHHDPLAPGGIGAGVNMSVRRSIVEAVGGFDNALDAGTVTKSGGDHEMYTRILGAGYRIIYDPAAINWHRHRNSDIELEKAIQGYGTGAYASMTRALLVDGEIGVFRIAWLWFRHGQARRLLRALIWRGSEFDRRLIKAELRGCVAGPYAYLRSVMNIRLRKLPRYG